MIIQVLLLVLGFALLVKGAEFFVDGASCIAAKLGIPQLVIGLTIVAMGTSMPEAAVSISATLSGNAGITIGNVIGSNILNILLILGITSLIANVKIQKSTLYYEIPFMIGISVVVALLGTTKNSIRLVEGIVLWGLFLIYLGYLFKMAKDGQEEQTDKQKQLSLFKCILCIVFGGVFIVKGSDFAVRGAIEIARFIGMSERFIGLTIVAFGTSLPELVTSVTAAKKGNADIAIGNIVGSNIFNILFIIGTSALISEIPFEPKFFIDTLISVACGVVLWIGTIKKKELRKPCGFVMLVLYLLYFLYLIQLH